MLIQSSPIPLQQIKNSITQQHQVNLFILRLDLNHPEISGNKLYKLHYNLEEASKLGKKSILTFGGAYSNHIAATAAVGKQFGFKTIGIIRGEKKDNLNPTLQLATDNGMQLHYVSREEYKNKSTNQFQDCYIIPEGGSNKLGIKGCTKILQTIPIDFDIICCPCGTGATLAGIILSLKNNQQAMGFQVLKAEEYIKKEVNKWLANFNYSSENNWLVNDSYHFGGYAKTTPALIHFIKSFEAENNIPLDFVYTAKMMFGILDLIEKGYFNKDKTIIAVHTGGLQGNAGLINRNFNEQKHK